MTDPVSLTPVAPAFRIDFIVHAGEVLMIFPEPYKYVHLSPGVAREIAANLMKMAEQIQEPKP